MPPVQRLRKPKKGRDMASTKARRGLRLALVRARAKRATAITQISARLEAERAPHNVPLDEFEKLPHAKKKPIYFQEARLWTAPRKRRDDAVEEKQRLEAAMEALWRDHPEAYDWTAEQMALHLQDWAPKYFPKRLPGKRKKRLLPFTGTNLLREVRFVLKRIRPRKKRRTSL
jgi:hypothetical protein